MLRLFILALLPGLFLSFASLPAVAQGPAKVMASVSPQIHQVLSGGFWRDKASGKSGFYRAGVVMKMDLR